MNGIVWKKLNRRKDTENVKMNLKFVRRYPLHINQIIRWYSFATKFTLMCFYSAFLILTLLNQ